MKHALYTVYFSGAVGNSMGLFYISDDVVAGIDVGSMQYDGRLVQNPADGRLEGIVEFVLTSGQTLITGTVGGSEPQRVPVHLSLPPDFANGVTVRIDTPFGPVNARFEKLKELP